MRALFEAVRDVCPRGLWAQGVKIARQGGVFRDSANPNESVLRIHAPDRAIELTVVLYPKDQEWDCNCGSRAAACSHVAAAVIALNGEREHGEAVPNLHASGQQLEYRFEQSGERLVLVRLINSAPLSGSLLALAHLRPSQADLVVDEAIRAAGARPLASAEFATILAALEGRGHITLDGHPVFTAGDPVMPLGVVRNDGDGVRLDVIANPAITAVVGDGVALCGDTLQPLGHIEITGPRLERLPFGKRVPPAGFADLVTETLPQLEADIPVEIHTTRLPEITTSAYPRVEIDVQQDECLSVLPTLVYGTPAIARIDGDRMVHLRGPAPVRDRTRERALLSRLRDELNLVPGRRVEYRGADAVRITERLRTWYGAGTDRSAPDYIMQSPLVPRVDVSAGFAILFESVEDSSADGSKRHASADAVIGAWQSGLELVPLEGGGWAPLPAAWLDEHGELVADLLAARNPDGTIPRFALPSLAHLCDDLDEPRPAAVDAVSVLLDGFDGIPEAALPDDFCGQLRHYQQEGVNWLSCLRDAGLGAILADDMGLGKTVQALCALRGRTLVVCPTSVLPSWAEQIARFRPGLSRCIYHGPDRELCATADVTLTTYALLRIDSVHLSAVEWDTIILDEAQSIKNPQSQVTRAANKLRGRFRLALSGTPVENRLDELWSQSHFANPGLLGSQRDFQRRYARPIARDEAGAAKRLRDRIRPFILRRLKEQVEPELPPRTDAIIYCELDEAERTLYDAIRAATREEIVSKLRQGGSVMAALEALLRLRQACCHRGLLPGQHADSSSKVRELVDSVEQVVANGHKALVFSQWTSLLDLVEPPLRATGIDFTRLDGSTRDRGAVVNQFQSEGGPPVMLISLKAGGTGLTLTAADHVFMLDPWWNPAVEDQAADRTHRIGQTRPVMVYRLVTADTVESRILALQEQKRALADAALGDASGAAGLTRDDLLSLLD
jgi:superfamily II DNA or RNA helicase